MKALIVDDEPLAVIRMQKMLEHFGITDIISASNGKKAIELTEKHHPHIVFLDIEMPVLSGIEAAPLIHHKSPETKIIFCTAYDDFAIKAFDLSASDYLLKPITKDRLKQALDKVITPKVKSLAFQHGKNRTSIPVTDIYCLYSEDKTTYMRCQLGTIIIDHSLVYLENKFPEVFTRVNRNALINSDELCGLQMEKSQTFAKLYNTNYQPKISRRNIAKLKKILK